MRQAPATSLALGLLQNFLSAGSFRYPQKQGFCSFSLVQHSGDGFGGPISAGRQGLSSVSKQTTALALGALIATTSASSSAAATRAAGDDDDLFIICNQYVLSQMQRYRFF